MNHPAIRTLEDLERIEVRNAAWLVYIHRRSLEVAKLIHRLRRFANHKPDSRVGRAVHQQADKIQERLNAILIKEGQMLKQVEEQCLETGKYYLIGLWPHEVPEGINRAMRADFFGPIHPDIRLDGNVVISNWRPDGSPVPGTLILAAQNNKIWSIFMAQGRSKKYDVIGLHKEGKSSGMG